MQNPYSNFDSCRGLVRRYTSEGTTLEMPWILLAFLFTIREVLAVPLPVPSHGLSDGSRASVRRQGFGDDCVEQTQMKEKWESLDKNDLAVGGDEGLNKYVNPTKEEGFIKKWAEGPCREEYIMKSSEDHVDMECNQKQWDSKQKDDFAWGKVLLEDGNVCTVINCNADINKDECDDGQ